ncbi:MAG TPA: hypothetical protein DCR97_11020 [Deltaproteobacteria bacterium]|nr:hypothetical protein [Deltaproteobacteria bacterium]
MTERRHFTRVLYQAEAIVTWGRRVVRGRSENVSLKGLFLQTSEKLPLGKNVRIKLFLQGLEDKCVELFGKVVRQENGGFGVQFSRMDFSDFMDLKSIVSLLVGDETHIVSEFTTSLYQGGSDVEA